jgi:hypothetical protein
MRLAPAVTAVAVSAALVGAGAAASPASAPVPVLGNAFPGTHGFGHAHPSLLSSGPAATVTVQHLRWTHWGAKEATALGQGWYVPDNAQSQADGKVATEKVVAFDLGTCHGKRAYLKYVWYFPAYRKPPSHRHANNACL